MEDSLKDTPGSTYIVLEGKHSDEANLVAIGYWYNSKVTLHFIIIKNSGSTRKESLNEMKFMDSYSNIYMLLVNWLSVISDFFEVLNIVDKYNQAWQYELALEKK